MKSVSIFFHPGINEDKGRLHVFAGEEVGRRKSPESIEMNVDLKYRLLMTANWQRSDSK
jgi:hypothetical protein